MRIVALILVIVAAHFGGHGAIMLGTSLQDQAHRSQGPEGIIYLLLAGALLLAASIVHRLQLFTSIPARSANIHEHHHAGPAFSGITMPSARATAQADADDPVSTAKPAKKAGGRTFLIEFDIDQIRSRWESQNRKATDEEVRVWLISLGYIPTPDGWLGDESSLHHFDRSEILRCRGIARTNDQLEETRRRQIQQTLRKMNGRSES